VPILTARRLRMSFDEMIKHTIAVIESWVASVCVYARMCSGRSANRLPPRTRTRSCGDAAESLAMARCICSAPTGPIGTFRAAVSAR
jgi:hypothetical protein